MSAAQLLKQVKALPVRERRKLLVAILTLEEESAKPAAGNIERVTWPNVEARAKLVFGSGTV